MIGPLEHGSVHAIGPDGTRIVEPVPGDVVEQARLRRGGGVHLGGSPASSAVLAGQSQAVLPIAWKYPPLLAASGAFVVASDAAMSAGWPLRVYQGLAASVVGGGQPTVVVLETVAGGIRTGGGVANADAVGRHVAGVHEYAHMHRDVPVIIVAVNADGSDAGKRNAEIVAECLRWRHAFREISVALTDPARAAALPPAVPGPAEFTPVPVERIPEHRLPSGRLYGFDFSESHILEVQKPGRRTEWSPRAYRVSSGATLLRSTMTPWAAWLEDGRVAPVVFGLESPDGQMIAVSRGDGRQIEEMLPARFVAFMLESPQVRAAIMESAQPTLVWLAWAARSGDTDAVLRLVEESLAELSRATGRDWDAHIMVAGELGFTHHGTLDVDAAVQVRHQPLPLSAASLSWMGSVYGFPAHVPGWEPERFRDFADFVNNGGQVPGPWTTVAPSGEPVAPLWFVVPPTGAGGGRVGLRSGKYADVDGVWAGCGLASQQGFAQGVQAGRPVVIFTPNPLGWHSYGAFAFDVVTGLHKAGLFPRAVYALQGDGDLRTILDPGMSYVDVSGFRAGDFKLSRVDDNAGRPRALVVHWPGDGAFVAQLEKWAKSVSDAQMGQVLLLDGAADPAAARHRPATARLPGGDEPIPPLLLVVRCDAAGFESLGVDDKAYRPSPRELMRVVAHDPMLREGLGHNGISPGAPGQTTRSVMIVPVGGSLVGHGDLVAEFAAAGYRRVVHWSDNEITFLADGQMSVVKPKFGTAPPLPVRAVDLWSAPLLDGAAEMTGLSLASNANDRAEDSALEGTDNTRSEFYLSIPDTNVPPASSKVILSPLAGRDHINITTHSDAEGRLAVAMRTGRPDEWGDIIRLLGWHGTEAIVGTQFFQVADPRRKENWRLIACKVNEPGVFPGGATLGYGIQRALYLMQRAGYTEWRGRTRIAGATTRVFVGSDHEVATDHGIFHEVAAPGEPVRPEVDLEVAAANSIAGMDLNSSDDDMTDLARRVVLAAWWRQRRLPPDQLAGAMPSVVITILSAAPSGMRHATERAHVAEQKLRKKMRDEADRHGLLVDLGKIPVTVGPPVVSHGGTRPWARVDVTISPIGDFDVVRSRDGQAIRELFRGSTGASFGAAFPTLWDTPVPDHGVVVAAQEPVSGQGVQRSGFEVRRFVDEQGLGTELVTWIVLDPDGRYDERTQQETLRAVQLGVEHYFNRGGPDEVPLKRPNGDRLVFKVLPWRPGQLVHHVVTMDPSRPIDQNNWHPGMSPEQGARAYGQGCGLMDENRALAGGVGVEGTLMGWWDPEKVDPGRLRMDAGRYAAELEWHISGFGPVQG
ncbi:hypothetical protein [Lentzea flava]|nr:hypothetical protein [Lentzea flava]